jgi:Spy/CpxP family protein refolding chaperone
VLDVPERTAPLQEGRSATHEEMTMPSTRWTQRFSSGLALMGSAALFGCTTAAARGPVPATAESSLTVDDDDLTSDLNDHHRHHQGGVTMFVALSLDTLGLAPERQAVVSKIQADIFAAMEPARAGGEKVLIALADGIAAGGIDRAGVDAAIADLEVASARVHATTVDAMNRLHAALTPVERGALVDRIRAQWAHSKLADDGPAESARRTGHLADLAREIGLSPDQVDRITVILHATMHGADTTESLEVYAYLTQLGAFRGDTFDAASLPGGAVANGHDAALGATRMARFYETVAPTLTPDQRPKLVFLLREHAGHRDEPPTAAH